MSNQELLDQVRRLRGEGKTPKQIARTLGLPPSKVAPLVRVVAAERDVASEPELVGCWVNAGWSAGLGIDPARGWEDKGQDPSSEGLVSVLLGRRHRWDKVSVCGYLTDVFCLGVKNVFGPEGMDEVELRRFLPEYFRAYPAGWQDAPIELAQHLVFGAEPVLPLSTPWNGSAQLCCDPHWLRRASAAVVD